MSEMGFQTFIEGTSFDVLETMGADFIIDTFEISAGTYTRSYPHLPQCTLTCDLMWRSTGGARDDPELTYSQSGNSITFTLQINAVVAIVAVPASGNGLADAFGFAASKNGGMLISPDFTPMVLVGIHDIADANTVYQSNVPSGNAFFAFHRADNPQGGFSSDMVLWDQVVQNGYHTLRMQGRSRGGCRVYIFSDMIPPPPDNGFFVYKNNKMVYHSNCLPLRYKKLTRLQINVYSETPLAVMNTISAIRAISTGTTLTTLGYAAGAGYSDVNKKWGAYLNGYQFSSSMTGGGHSSSFDSTLPYLSYIECEYYDKYYKQSLGIK